MRYFMLGAALATALAAPGFIQPGLAQTSLDPALIAQQIAQTTTAPPPTSPDVPAATTKVDSATFVKTAATAGDFEIESSKLALEKSQDPKIRQFAQQMIDDHTRIAAALQKNNTQQALPSGTDDKHQAQLKTLKGLSGAAFDKQYVKDQLAAHEAAVTLFTAYSQSGDDNNLKGFASETLPTLQQHSHMIQTMAVM